MGILSPLNTAGEGVILGLPVTASENIIGTKEPPTVLLLLSQRPTAFPVIAPPRHSVEILLTPPVGITSRPHLGGPQVLRPETRNEVYINLILPIIES